MPQKLTNFLVKFMAFLHGAVVGFQHSSSLLWTFHSRTDNISSSQGLYRFRTKTKNTENSHPLIGIWSWYPSVLTTPGWCEPYTFRILLIFH